MRPIAKGHVLRMPAAAQRIAFADRKAAPLGIDQSMDIGGDDLLRKRHTAGHNIGAVLNDFNFAILAIYFISAKQFPEKPSEITILSLIICVTNYRRILINLYIVFII